MYKVLCWSCKTGNGLPGYVTQLARVQLPKPSCWERPVVPHQSPAGPCPARGRVSHSRQCPVSIRMTLPHSRRASHLLGDGLLFRKRLTLAPECVSNQQPRNHLRSHDSSLFCTAFLVLCVLRVSSPGRGVHIFSLFFPPLEVILVTCHHISHAWLLPLGVALSWLSCRGQPGGRSRKPPLLRPRAAGSPVPPTVSPNRRPPVASPRQPCSGLPATYLSHTQSILAGQSSKGCDDRIFSAV